MANPLQVTEVPIANADFEQSGSIPPDSWQPVGPGLAPAPPGSLTLAYETATPYAGTQSLQLTATDQLIGVASISGPGILKFPCKSGEYYKISGALRYVSGGMQPRITAQFWSSVTTTLLGEVELLATLTDNAWHFGTATATAPWGTYSIGTGPDLTDFADLLYIVVGCRYVQGGGASTTEWQVDSLNCQRISAIDYYLNLLTSEYSQAANFKKWLSIPAGVLSQLMYMLQKMPSDFDPDLAIGVQLDVLGLRVGVSRLLPFQPTGGSLLTLQPDGMLGLGYVSGDVVGIAQVGASGGTARWIFNPLERFPNQFLTVVAPGTNYNPATNVPVTGGSGSGGHCDIVAVTFAYSAVLTDDNYRILIKAKIMQNQWDGQMHSLYPQLASLFPGAVIKILDNQDMTATIIMAIGTIDNLMQQIISAGLIIPRPETVQYNYVFSQFPIYGADLDTSLIAGADTGFTA